MHLVESTESIHINWPLEGFDRPEKLRQLHDGVGGKVVHPKTKPGQNLRKDGVQWKTQTSSKEVPKHHTLSITRDRCSLIIRGTANSGAKAPFLLITLD